MKNIVYMVNIVHDARSKSQKYEWSVQSWKNWCKNNNAELFILDQKLYELDYMAPQMKGEYLIILIMELKNI